MGRVTNTPGPGGGPSCGQGWHPARGAHTRRNRSIGGAMSHLHVRFDGRQFPLTKFKGNLSPRCFRKAPTYATHLSLRNARHAPRECDAARQPLGKGEGAPLFSSLGISVGVQSQHFKICHFLRILLHTAKKEKGTEVSGQKTPSPSSPCQRSHLDHDRLLTVTDSTPGTRRDNSPCQAPPRSAQISLTSTENTPVTSV